MALNLPTEYRIELLEYPHDAAAFLSVVEAAFAKDPNLIHIEQYIRNNKTRDLRKKLRLSRFKNTIEGLNSGLEDVEKLYAKVVHVPSNTIAGVCCWDFARKTAHVEASKDPYPDLPPGESFPAEDAGLLLINQRLDGLLKSRMNTLEILGPEQDRTKKWWYLSMLAVHPEHQGNQLGQHMMAWGISKAKDDAAARPELGIKGVRLESTEAGVKTYKNAGFCQIDVSRVIFGALDQDALDWDVVDCDYEDSAGLKATDRKGQNCTIMILEF